MIPELGHFALAMALALAVLQTVIPLAGAARGNIAWMSVARPAARAQCAFVLMAFAALTYAFVTNDFSVAYVAQNSNSAMPVAYKISAVWGAHEGSLLLWVTILCIWTVAVSVFSRSLPLAFVARVLGVMGFVSIGFLLFMLLTSNPFLRLIPAAVNGADLNPLLQDPGLVFHPPILYTGYVGFSVAFGFAIAALLGGQLTTTWARWSRPWTIAAWAFLTIGVALGSWWAYYELGWGGWWFWDPVENASFMPWLLGTALIHSLAVTEKRGTFKNWTVLLAIGTFSLSLLGTFLVRSGVLTSVHAFASDPTRGVFVLGFLGVVIGGSLALYAWRGPGTLSGGSFDRVSRETFLLANSVLLVVACSTVLLGTIYPLVLEALDLGKISVGPPYFNAVFIPLMTPVVLLLGFGQFARWKNDSLHRLWAHVRYAVYGTIAIGLLCALVLFESARLQATLGVALAAWIILSTLLGVWSRCTERRSPWTALITLPPAFIGQCLAHIGFAMTIVGVTITSTHSTDEHQRMAPGDSINLSGYDFHFDGLSKVNGPNYEATEGIFTIKKNGRVIAELSPQKRIYDVRNMPMTEAGIDPGLTRDLYVSLGEPLEDGAWSVRLHYKPFVRWIWLGAVFMGLGGAIAASDKRFRILKRARSSAPDLAATALSGKT